jgi:hypothetical protein
MEFVAEGLQYLLAVLLPFCLHRIGVLLPRHPRFQMKLKVICLVIGLKD